MELFVLLLIIVGPLLLLVGGAGIWLALRARKARRRQFLDDAWQRIDDEPEQALEGLDRFVAQHQSTDPENDPLLHRAHFGRALCFIRLERFEEAEAADEAARAAGEYAANDLTLLCDVYAEAVEEGEVPGGALAAFTRYLLLPDKERVEKTARAARNALKRAVSAPADADEGEIDAAIRRGQTLAKLGLKEAWLFAAIGQLCYRRGRHPEAIKLLTKALAAEPDRAADLFTLGKAYRKSGEHREARRALLQAVQKDSDQDPNIAFEAARACLRWSEEPLEKSEQLSNRKATPVETARDLLDAVVKKSPAYAPGWLELGNARLRLQQAESATQAVEKALALDPNLAGAQASLGQCWLARGDRDKARAALAQAQEKHPNMIETVRLAGDLAHDEGRYADALGQYRRIDPKLLDDPVLLERLARCYLETGNTARTIELLEGTPPANLAVRLLLGRAQARSGRWADALETLQGTNGSDLGPEYRYYRAAALAANGKHAEAEPIFNDLMALPQWQARASQQLGHLKVLAGDFKSARQYYSANTHPGAALNLGRLALVERDSRAARQHFEQAAKDPNASPAVRCGLAMTRALGGQENVYGEMLQDPDLARWAHEQIGRRAYKASRFADALESLLKAARGQARVSSTLICLLANSYLALNRYTEALPYLLELARRFPRLAAVRHNLALCRFHAGLAYFRRGQWDSARQEWNRSARLLKPLLPEQAGQIQAMELEASYRVVSATLQGDKKDDLETTQNLCEIACKEVPDDPRWWFAAGLAAAARDEHKRAAECFVEARRHDKSRVSFSLGASLSFLALDRHEQARLTLEKTLELAEQDADPKHAMFPIATRFALTSTYAKKKMWAEAAGILDPLLTHPLIRSSQRIQPADVAQAMVAYYALAGDRERAADLARKYLEGQGAIGNLLIGLVQAEGGDYAGAAETLESAYQQDPRPEIASVLVGCLLAEASRLILEGDLKGASPLVRHALKIDPNHADAKKLEAALSFGSRLKELDPKQLEKTIRECESLIEESSEGSAQLTRTLGVLYHRKALQAERAGKNVDEAWDACVKYWRKRIFNSDGFWKSFEEEYNQGKDKRGRIKADDLAQWRKDLPGDLAADHAAYTSHYIRNWEKKGIKRHLALIWDWAPDWTPPNEFLLRDLQNADDSKLEFFGDLMNSVKNAGLKRILGELAAGFWNGKALAKMNLAIDQANRAINLANTVVNLVNSLGGAAHLIRGQVVDSLRTSVNLLSDAKSNCREALNFGEKATSMAPQNQVFRENVSKFRDEQRKINENYDAISGLLRQIS